MTDDETKIQQFKQLGFSASFHFADDTGKEFNKGIVKMREALQVFDDNPALQPAMREVGRGFLWSLNRERPGEK